MQPLMLVKKEENLEWKEEDQNTFKNIMIGYKECMPFVDEILLEARFFMNTHMLNSDFKKDPKYFIAFDDKNLKSQNIVAISALYVFSAYRKQGFAKLLLEQIKFLAQKDIVLQIAVNEKKFNDLKKFYLQMGFQTTGKINQPDALGIKYIDLFWCNSPIKLTTMNSGTKIEKL